MDIQARKVCEGEFPGGNLMEVLRGQVNGGGDGIAPRRRSYRKHKHGPTFCWDAWFHLVPLAAQRTRRLKSLNVIEEIPKSESRRPCATPCNCRQGSVKETLAFEHDEIRTNSNLFAAFSQCTP